MKHFLWNKVLPFFMALFFYPYLCTLRVTQLELQPDLSFKPFRRDRKKTYIFAHWHEDIPVFCLAYSFSRFSSMASRSRDGELITRVLAWLGIKIVRGSSRHFGPGTIKEISHVILNENRDFALAVDGPKGPRHKVKDGIFYLADKTQKAVIPAAANAKHKWVFSKSWDKMWFPMPFSKCVFMFGQPKHFPVKTRGGLVCPHFELSQTLQLLKEKAVRYYT